MFFELISNKRHDIIQYNLSNGIKSTNYLNMNYTLTTHYNTFKKLKTNVIIHDQFKIISKQ